MATKKTTSDMEVLLQLARESIERYGTALPPLPRQTGKPRRGLANADTDWSKVKSTCSGCGKEGYVEPDFGTRQTPRAVYKQSRCRECRNQANYYGKARTYKKQR